MLPFIPLMLGGAGLGALLNKKDPLKGAMMGAALGAGGAALPGLLGAGGATAGIGGAATAGATEGAAAGGLLAGGEQAAMLAAQNAGLEGATAATNAGLGSNAGLFGAEQAAAPVADMSTQAGMFDKLNHQTNGLLGNATDTYSKYAKPIEATMNAAQQGQQMAQANDPPPIQAPQRQNIPLDLSSILNQSTQWQQFDMAENERRKQLMQNYASNIGRMG